MNSIEPLPVTHCLADIVAAVQGGAPVVLKAPPGAGKTTGVPPALVADGVADEGQIWIVQPRRLAARTAASRLAELLDSALGDRVGYHIRFDRRSSNNTQLLVMTTGVLLRRLQSDPLLESTACVILDEFHERSLELDLALGMLQRIRTTLRPELRMIVMSATLDPEPVARFLGDESVSITSEGRSYPVEIHHAAVRSEQPLEEQIARTLPRALQETDGHVLVFLPGVGEIRRVSERIGRGLAADADVFELFGDLPQRRQDAVMRETGRRKVILSTNVAETSITIAGVTAVIDSGLVRTLRFDANVGLPRLQLEPNSQASAEQRSGRAGRTAPGIAFRLWPANTHRARPESDTPEIERGDLSAAVLMLAAWGERDVFDFPWLTPPPPAGVELARDLLQKLDAIDASGTPSPLGRKMVELPVHPRMGKFLLSASNRGRTAAASLAAALLTERDPFPRDRRSPPPNEPHRCDVSERVERLRRFFSRQSSEPIDTASAHRIGAVARQLERLVNRQSSAGDSDADTSLARCLLAAYPDRVARRRESGSDRGLMVGRRGVRLDRRSAVRDSELFICIDVDSGQSEGWVRSASAIEEAWLDDRLIDIQEEYSFDTELEAVVARRTRYYIDLPLAEQPIPCQPSEQVAALLFAAVGNDLTKVMPIDSDQAIEFIRRARFLARRMPEVDFADTIDSLAETTLRTLCRNCTSLRELRQAAWLDHLRGQFSYEQLQQIDRHAPAAMTVPSGNRIRIHYDDDRPPRMEVRIQELFGWDRTPRIAADRIAVQLHLLGPNHRIQQITEDLENFWQTTYIEVRKQLRGRYPKHHWPEDPTTATATRNGLKPK